MLTHICGGHCQSRRNELVSTTTAAASRLPRVLKYMQQHGAQKHLRLRKRMKNPPCPVVTRSYNRPSAFYLTSVVTMNGQEFSAATSTKLEGRRNLEHAV